MSRNVYDFEDLDDLVDDLLDDVEELMNGQLTSEIEAIYHEESVNIYGEYTPKRKSRYRRYQPYSFGDRRNITTTVKRNGYSITLETWNKAKGTGSNKDEELGWYIEEAEYPYADEAGVEVPKRPVSERVAKRVDDSDLVEKNIINVLRYQGWDIE